MYNLKYDVKKRKSFVAGDMSNYVEITLKNGKQIKLALDDQEDFIKTVNEHSKRTY